MERLKRALEKARGGGAATAIPLDATTVPQPARPTSTSLMSSQAQIWEVDPRSLERHRIIAGNKDDPRTASFDLLRTQVLREMSKNGARTLVVTSPNPGCGKTTVAINLALSIGQLSEPGVVLGDLDFRRPKVTEYLGIRPEKDLFDYVAGNSALEEVLIDPGIPYLRLLPNTKARRSAAELLTSPRMQALVETLKAHEQGPVAILDLPPLLSTDDTIAFLPQADAILLVVADGSTKKPELEESLRLLEGAPLLGVVLNKSHASLQPYSYY